jgi:hypothetical protein
LKLILLFFTLKSFTNLYQYLSIVTNFYQSLSLFTNSKLINALQQKILMPIASSLRAQASMGRPRGLIRHRRLLSILPPPPQQQTSSTTAAAAAAAAANEALLFAAPSFSSSSSCVIGLRRSTNKRPTLSSNQANDAQRGRRSLA